MTTKTVKVAALSVHGTLRTTMPDKPGLWFLSCGENEGEYEAVAIFERDGVMYIEDLALGVTALEHYHNGITSPCWLRHGE